MIQLGILTENLKTKKTKSKFLRFMITLCSEKIRFTVKALESEVAYAASRYKEIF